MASPTSAVTLPDGASGSTNGKGFTSTGLARAQDGTWWVGNHGKAQDTDPTYAPSLVHVSADFSTILGEIVLAPLYSGIQTVQGVAYDTSDDSLWFADVQNQTVRHISTGGTPQSGDIVLSYQPNGIAYVPADDALYVNDVNSDTLEERACADGGLVSTQTVTVSDRDQLSYVAATGHLLYSWGVNGTNGKVNVYSTAGGTLTLDQTVTLPGATAIEGVALVNGVLYEVNDAYFHLGGANLNQALTFTTNMQ